MDNEYENNQNEQDIIPGLNQMKPIRINEPDSEHTDRANNDGHLDEDAYDISSYDISSYETSSYETGGYQPNSYFKSYGADDYSPDNNAPKSRYTPVETNWRQEVRNDIGIKTAVDYAPETKRKSSKLSIWLLAALILVVILAAVNMGDSKQYLDKPINGTYTTNANLRIDYMRGEMLKNLTFSGENECSISDGRVILPGTGTYTLEDSELIMTFVHESEYNTGDFETDSRTNEILYKKQTLTDSVEINFTINKITSDSFVLSLNSVYMSGSTGTFRYKNHILKYSKTG